MRIVIAHAAAPMHRQDQLAVCIIIIVLLLNANSVQVSTSLIELIHGADQRNPVCQEREADIMSTVPVSYNVILCKVTIRVM